MRCVAILGIPPISTAVDAVRAYNAAQTQDRFKAARKLTSKKNDRTTNSSSDWWKRVSNPTLSELAKITSRGHIAIFVYREPEGEALNFLRHCGWNGERVFKMTMTETQNNGDSLRQRWGQCRSKMAFCQSSQRTQNFCCLR